MPRDVPLAFCGSRWLCLVYGLFVLVFGLLFSFCEDVQYHLTRVLAKFKMRILMLLWKCCLLDHSKLHPAKTKMASHKLFVSILGMLFNWAHQPPQTMKNIRIFLDKHLELTAPINLKVVDSWCVSTINVNCAFTFHVDHSNFVSQTQAKLIFSLFVASSSPVSLLISGVHQKSHYVPNKAKVVQRASQ